MQRQAAEIGFQQTITYAQQCIRAEFMGENKPSALKAASLNSSILLKV